MQGVLAAVDIQIMFLGSGSALCLFYVANTRVRHYGSLKNYDKVGYMVTPTTANEWSLLRLLFVRFIL